MSPDGHWFGTFIRQKWYIWLLSISKLILIIHPTPIISDDSRQTEHKLRRSLKQHGHLIEMFQAFKDIFRVALICQLIAFITLICSVSRYYQDHVRCCFITLSTDVVDCSNSWRLFLSNVVHEQMRICTSTWDRQTTTSDSPCSHILYDHKFVLQDISYYIIGYVFITFGYVYEWYIYGLGKQTAADGVCQIINR